MSTHELHMQRAIELAKQAQGCTSPNPLVGCVVVKNDVVVGSGWHSAAGEAHAEAVALAEAGELGRGATLYVSLEPCSHHGRTPPCTSAIIAAGVARVIYAAADTNARATGGAKLLREAGIDTLHGVLEGQARHLNRFYFHHIAHGLPYVVAKFAASLDGRIATRTQHSKWITGQAARQRGHRLRQSVDAIVVGAQTVINDDPRLTVRLADSSVKCCHPLRVILDSHGRVPLDSQVFSAELPGQTLVATTASMTGERVAQLQARGIEVLEIRRSATEQVSIPELLEALGKRGVQSLMIEGGPNVLGAFFDAQLVNEVWAFLAPKLIGGRDAPAAIAGLGIDQLSAAPQLHAMHIEQLDGDVLITGQLDLPQASPRQTDSTIAQLAETSS